MRKFLHDFRDFAIKGNIMDLAVGVIIGTAFTAIVNSLVKDIFMPLLSLLTQGLDFSALVIPLGEGEGAAMLSYGSFIQAVINFVLIAFVVFLFVRTLAKTREKLESLKKKEPEPPKPEKRLCPFCRMEIAPDATRCPHCTSMLNDK